MRRSNKIRIAHTIKEARGEIDEAWARGEEIGSVPTMGYLHEGHLSLIDLAKKDSGYVVVSIFVNPTQFGPNEDFQNYPRDFERDRQMLESRGAALIFAPDVAEMYPQRSRIRFELDTLGDHLCGARRPGHFSGVLQVVTKLFHIIQPDVAIFGQKDLQQLLIIRRLVNEFDFPIKIIAGATLREPDGLAMSSRNSYLSIEERREAAVLNHALQHAKKLLDSGERRAERVIDAMRELIQREVPSGKIDYIEIVNLEDLQPISRCEKIFAIALAVYLGKTKLIDNIVLKIDGENVEEIRALN
ncbi:pantoate--beta-alanine ligase [Candidatus Acetothermia bacterium]|nr:pantoate--beta-alanine ligase [Candidatus Acetothermia bacterium]MBI3643079.1 pantoate--beta-alanine ligase [Candidatus Acetothermia bacterium]